MSSVELKPGYGRRGDPLRVGSSYFDSKLAEYLDQLDQDPTVSSLATKSACKIWWRRFFRFIGFRRSSISEITIEDIHQWLKTYRGFKVKIKKEDLNEPYTAATLLAAQNAINRLIRTMKRDNSTLKTIPITRADFKEAYIPSKKQVDAISESLPKKGEGTWSQQRERLIISFFIHMGLRISEIPKIRMGDLFIEEGIIRKVYLRRKYRHEGFVPISSLMAEEIKSWIDLNPPLLHTQFILCGGEENIPLTARRIGQIVTQKLNSISSLENRSLIHPHSFRHFFIMEMIKKGTPLPILMWLTGHSSIKSLTPYIHRDEEAMQVWIEMYAQGVKSS